MKREDFVALVDVLMTEDDHLDDGRAQRELDVQRILTALEARGLAVVPVVAEGTFAECDWPVGEPFSVFDPDPNDIHGCVYLVMPGGAMVQFHHHGSETVDIARANWIMDACNDRRTAMLTASKAPDSD